MQTDSKGAPAGSGTTAEGETAKPKAETRTPSEIFDFEHKVFSIEGGHFSLSSDKAQAVYFVPLGSTFGAVPLSTLRTTFDIAVDSYDDRLLGIVEASLRYVKIIRPGESIPRELLDGTASWQVSDENRARARNRLLVQLASWVSGKEIVVSDAAQIEQIVEDPGTKQRVTDAYVQLTQRLGLPPERQNEIEVRVGAFAHELAYIEALRDRFGAVRSILGKIERLRNAYRLDQVDAQSGEVLALMKNLDSQIAFTRRMRDDLHMRVMDWDDMIEKWDSVEIERSNANENMVKSTYRFLAQRYLKTNVWKRD